MIWYAPNYREKADRLIAAGPERLHIITDFDRTLTAGLAAGEKAPTTYQNLRNSGLLPEECRIRGNELYEKYYPIEVSDLPWEEKNAKMIEWWRLFLEAMIEYGLTKQMLETLKDTKPLQWRRGAREFLREADRAGIPLLIFSAGLGDLIRMYLEKEGLMSDTIHIISNHFRFDDSGKVLGYAADPVHSLNKTEQLIRGTDFAEEIERRPYAMLLGDIIEDAGMAKGQHHQEIVRFGFCNHAVEKRLADFQKHFDVIITGDGAIAPVRELLRSIVR